MLRPFEMLVWNKNETDLIPDEMEELLDDVRMSLADMGIKHSFICFEFPEGTRFIDAVNESRWKIYRKNKALRFMETGVYYRLYH